MRQKWGIVGIGKLGNAILTQFDHYQLETGVYHPDLQKAEGITETYRHTKSLHKEELASLDYLIMALPANQIIPFITDYEANGLTLQNTTLINVATAMPTETLQLEFPERTWVGMKFVGHSESLKKYGEGLFITDEGVLKNPAYREVYSRFSYLGQVMAEEESVVEEVNKLATYHAIKAAREMEQKMIEQGFSDLFEDQTLRSIMPEVIRAYSKGQIGHFAKEIVKKLDQE
ncbi:hypothetical protein [Salipaludibacillus daqingensis]|uniref:hypothetical protein n=1 Tax=Salipaludibacillus daqingensis TaxID=3041001 RepID=UPI002473AF0B|nr:hypothetical protein [Salipaludibacillus daqingensis]